MLYFHMGYFSFHVQFRLSIYFAVVITFLHPSRTAAHRRPPGLTPPPSSHFPQREAVEKAPLHREVARACSPPSPLPANVSTRREPSPSVRVARRTDKSSRVPPAAESRRHLLYGGVGGDSSTIYKSHCGPRRPRQLCLLATAAVAASPAAWARRQVAGRDMPRSKEEEGAECGSRGEQSPSRRLAV